MIGAVLAGGNASRFGGGDKGMHRVGGTTILERVAAVLGAGCAPVLLNVNGDPARFAALGLPVVADALPDRPGPLAGVLAALDWAAAHRPDVAHLVTAPGDTPFLPRDLVARFTAAQQHTGADIVAARSAGRAHPVAALWNVALREDLHRALTRDGLRKVGLYLERHRVAYVEFASDPVEPFFNVNTLDDLATAETIAQSLAMRGD